jgi:hypothetical protein
MRLPNRTLVLAPLLLLAACVDNKVSIELRHVCAPPDTASTCAFAATCDAVSLTPFFFDVGAGSSRMWLFVEVGNQLESNAATGDGRVNSRDAFVQEAVITYEGGGLGLASASHRLQQMISPGTTQVLSLFPLPDSATAELATFTITGIVDIVAKLKLKGVYGDGSSFETGEYEIPIRICNNCLNAGGPLGCPTAGDLLFACPPDAVTSGGQLAQLPASTECVAP